MHKNKRKEGMKKMRKIFKKVVAAVASAAMLAGLVAGMPTMEAKAGTLVGEKTIYVSVPDDNDYVINVWTGLVSDAGTDERVTWCKTMTKVQDKLFKITGEVYDDFAGTGDGNGLQVVAVDSGGSNVGEYKCSATDPAKNANWNAVSAAVIESGKTEVWLELDTTNWTIKVGSPVTITATDADIAQGVEDKIDAALALSATKENKAAYDTAKSAYNGLTDAQKALVDATKLASLETKIREIQAIIDAENAAAAGTITIYVQNSLNWEAMNLYSWNGSTEFFGAWPGRGMTACEKNSGWYSAKYQITAPTNIIFNNNNNGSQTKDIENVVAGTYWVTLTLVEGENNASAAFSTTAPSGWVDEEANEIETNAPSDPTTNNNNNNNNNGAPATGDATPYVAVIAAMLALGCAVVALNAKKENE